MQNIRNIKSHSPIIGDSNNIKSNNIVDWVDEEGFTYKDLLQKYENEQNKTTQQQPNEQNINQNTTSQKSADSNKTELLNMLSHPSFKNRLSALNGRPLHSAAVRARMSYARQTGKQSVTTEPIKNETPAPKTNVDKSANNSSTIEVTPNVMSQTKLTGNSDENVKYAIVTKKIMVGDVNGDGKIDIRDTVALKMHMTGLEEITDEEALKRADVNNDGKINAADLGKLVDYQNGEIGDKDWGDKYRDVNIKTIVEKQYIEIVDGARGCYTEYTGDNGTVKLQSGNDIAVTEKVLSNGKKWIHIDKINLLSEKNTYSQYVTFDYIHLKDGSDVDIAVHGTDVAKMTGGIATVKGSLDYNQFRFYAEIRNSEIITYSDSAYIASRGNNSITTKGDKSYIMYGENDVIDVYGEYSTVNSYSTSYRSNNCISVRGGNSSVEGGEGKDTIYLYGDNVTVNTGAGDDNIVLRGNNAFIRGGQVLIVS